MSPTTKAMTADDLWRLPDTGKPYELVKGALHAMSPAGGEHGDVTMNLGAPLWTYATLEDLGKVLAAETGFILTRNPDTVRAADIAFIRKDRIPATGLPKKYIPFPPDLSVEVVSPNDTLAAVEEKVLEWLHAGTKLVWVVIPRTRTVQVYRTPTDVTVLTDQDELDGGDVVPGFRLPIARIFR